MDQSSQLQMLNRPRKQHRAEWLRDHCASSSIALEQAATELDNFDRRLAVSQATIDAAREEIRRELQAFASVLAPTETRLDRIDTKSQHHQSVVGLVQSLEAELKGAKAVCDKHADAFKAQAEEKAKAAAAAAKASSAQQALNQSARSGLSTAPSTLPATAYTKAAGAAAAVATPSVTAPPGMIVVTVRVPSTLQQETSAVPVTIAPTATLADLVAATTQALKLASSSLSPMKVAFADKIFADSTRELRQCGIAATGAEVELVPENMSEGEWRLEGAQAKLKDLKTKSLEPNTTDAGRLALHEAATKILISLDGVEVEGDARAARKLLINQLQAFQDSLMPACLQTEPEDDGAAAEAAADDAPDDSAEAAADAVEADAADGGDGGDADGGDAPPPKEDVD